MVNDKKSSNREDKDDDGYLAIEDVSEKKIAETVVNTLLKDAKRRPINLSVEEVERNLLKPIQLNKEDSIDDAFKKFKDAHMKSEAAEEKDGQLKLK